jgi:hypothetical protein
MVLRKFLACTLSAMTALAATACADGTGKALTPTLPTVDSNVTNSDGTLLKATAPQPTSPRSAVRISNLTPLLTLQNGSGTYDPDVALAYQYQLFEGATLVQESELIAAGGDETSWTVPAGLLEMNKTYNWRARASYAGVLGSWSDGVSFRTPVPPPISSGGPVFCAGGSGPEIVACVARAYPEKLVKTSTGDFSDERRAKNMEFIRDRIIETGRCKGMNLGQNFKRGTPVISKDFIVLRGQGHDKGVDIARGYDATSSPLQLTWQVFERDKNYGHPFYRNYGPVDCSNLN